MPTLIPFDSFGPALHAALVKCHSTPADIASYVAVGDLSFAWRSYVEHIVEGFRKFPATTPTAAAALLKVSSLAWDFSEVAPTEAKAIGVLKSSFNRFTDLDWRTYAQGLYE